jgi:hypothetical protein
LISKPIGSPRDMSIGNGKTELSFATTFIFLCSPLRALGLFFDELFAVGGFVGGDHFIG